MSVYRPRKLVEGYKVDVKYAGLTLVAVPKQKLTEECEVQFESKSMVITKGKTELKTVSFPQRFGTGEYTLCYFKWEPTQDTLF